MESRWNLGNSPGRSENSPIAQVLDHGLAPLAWRVSAPSSAKLASGQQDFVERGDGRQVKTSCRLGS